MKTIKLLLVLLSFTSLNLNANVDALDFSKDSFCPISPKVQYRGGRYYLPNNTKPYSGKASCAYLINGQLSMKGQIKQGLESGEWLEWYVNGQIKSKGFYQDGQRSGVFTQWYDNGQKGSEGKWSYNDKIGQWQYWFRNGQMSESTIYKDGAVQQPSLFWNKEGNPYSLPTIKTLQTGWAIQLASIKSKDNAKTLRNMLIRENYPAYLRARNLNFRVLIGPYDTRGLAGNMRTELHQRYGLQGIVINITEEEYNKKAEAKKLAAVSDELDSWLEGELANQEGLTNAQALASATAYIHDEVRKRWKRPPDVRNGMFVEVRVRLGPTGEVISVEVVSRDATDALVTSVRHAVLKVGRFDKLRSLDREIFDANFREFKIRFIPEDLRL